MECSWKKKQLQVEYNGKPDMSLLFGGFGGMYK